MLDRRAHQIRPPEAQPGPIPEHRIASKDRRQGGKRHAPLAQEERVLHLRRAPDPIGQEKGRPQGENCARRFEFDAPQTHVWFAHVIASVEPIALRQGLRKQLRVVLRHLRQIGPILGHVGHTLLIVRFTRKRHADMVTPTGWRTRLCFCVVHHSTVWQIFGPPSRLGSLQVYQPQNPLERETQIKGVEDSLTIYEVLGIGPLRTRLQVAARRGLTRFVGRQSEMEQLQHALVQAKVGHGQIVGVMGEPGLGKSRLFYEFKLISHSGCLVLEAYSVSYGKASPYLPVIELLKSYFQIEPPG